MEGNLFLFGLAVSALDMFDFAPRAEHPYLHKHFEEMCYDISPKLVKIHYKETDEISGSKGDEEKVNLSKKTFIPGSEKEQEYQYLDIKNYVNDVNRENSEVLEVQDENGVEKEGYTYGLNRIEAKIGKDNVTYNYSGRGDVSSINTASGKKYSYNYDSYGNLLKDDGSAIGALRDKKKSGAFRNSFTYNGEQTDYSTNLQYLRNRYLDTETGTFLTEDTYRGSLTNLKSHNRYSYAENNPVNKIDPSGHKAKSISAKKARALVKASSNAAKRIAGVSTSNRAGNQKASRAKSSHSTHKAKTASSKSSGHKAKKSSGGGLVNSFLGFCSKRLNQAKKAIKKAYKKVCTTAHRAKKFVVNTAKNVTKKAVSVVKSAGKAFVKFKQEHPILTGALIIGAAGVLTLATGGLGTGVLATAISGACSGAFVGSAIGAGAGATIGFVDGLISGKGLKGALNEAAQGFGTGAFSGAISGGFAGAFGVGVGAQRAIRTLGNTLGDLGGRALDGEKITAGDVVLSLGVNAAFNYGGPKVLNKVKNTRIGQAVDKGISKLNNKVSEANAKIANKVVSKTFDAKTKVASTVSNLKESFVNNPSRAGGIRNRIGNPVKPIEKSLDMSLNPEMYASEVAKKYRINLKGSGQKISILYNSELASAGRTKAVNPNVIEIGPSALYSEEELANTIAHELNHARSFIKGGNAPEWGEGGAYPAGNALAEYIRGER